jgi:hypothetical protein
MAASAATPRGTRGVAFVGVPVVAPALPMPGASAAIAALGEDPFLAFVVGALQH